MNVLVYLIPIALGLGLLGLFGFMWTLRSGQYDDLEGAKWRILEDDDLPEDRRRPRDEALALSPSPFGPSVSRNEEGAPAAPHFFVPSRPISRPSA